MQSSSSERKGTETNCELVHRAFSSPSSQCIKTFSPLLFNLFTIRKVAQEWKWIHLKFVLFLWFCRKEKPHLTAENILTALRIFTLHFLFVNVHDDILHGYTQNVLIVILFLIKPCLKQSASMIMIMISKL